MGRSTTADARVPKDGRKFWTKENLLSPRTVLVASVAVLMVLGLIMLFSVTSTTSIIYNATYGTNLTVWEKVTKQMLFQVVGIVAAVVAYRLAGWWSRPVPTVVVTFAVIGLLLLIFTPLGFSVNNARRWIDLGSLGSLQPSEFAKVACVLCMAQVLVGLEGRPDTFSVRGVLAGILGAVLEFLRGLLTHPIATLGNVVRGFLGWIGDTIRRNGARINVYEGRAHNEGFGSKVFVGCLALVVLMFVLIYLEVDHGTLIIIGAAIVCMYYFAGGSQRFFLFLVAVVAVGVLVFVAVVFPTMIANPYSADRFSLWLTPVDEMSATQLDLGGVQVRNGIYALASGGLFGVGIGNSTQKYSWLSEAEDDYVFAIIGEELGLVGTVGVVLLFGLFAWAGFRIARDAARYDRRLSIIASGLTCCLIIQAFINVGGIIKLLPLTGRPLPFISSGGSATLVSLIIVGMLLGINRRTRQSAVVYVDRASDARRSRLTVIDGGQAGGNGDVRGRRTAPADGDPAAVAKGSQDRGQGQQQVSGQQARDRAQGQQQVSGQQGAPAQRPSGAQLRQVPPGGAGRGNGAAGGSGQQTTRGRTGTGTSAGRPAQKQPGTTSEKTPEKTSGKTPGKTSGTTSGNDTGGRSRR